ncbi:MAG: flagellar basal body rod protein FlgC [Gemmatimonadota bacterium]|nr:flagellar basal body rod protein FlgC [Gemmatimonadota bacterium]
MPDPVNPNQGAPSLIRPMFRTLGIAASGLSAQRLRMETIATNIANAETTHTTAGGPYRRRMVQMEAATAEDFQKSLAAAKDAAADRPSIVGRGNAEATDPLAAAEAKFEKRLNEADKVSGLAAEEAEDAAASAGEGWGVRVSAIVEDESEGPLVYDPAHPDADANGYVRYPNVRITDELVDLMDAKRMYEANATVFNATKQMLRRAIEI